MAMSKYNGEGGSDMGVHRGERSAVKRWWADNDWSI